jgi:hypothetical protein
VPGSTRSAITAVMKQVLEHRLQQAFKLQPRVAAMRTSAWACHSFYRVSHTCRRARGQSDQLALTNTPIFALDANSLAVRPVANAVIVATARTQLRSC